MKKITDHNELPLLATGDKVVNKYGIWVKNMSGTWWLDDMDWDRPENIVPCYLIEEGDFD